MEGIATPACGLVRNDIKITGFFYTLSPIRKDGAFIEHAMPVIFSMTGDGEVENFRKNEVTLD